MSFDLRSGEYCCSRVRFLRDNGADLHENLLLLELPGDMRELLESMKS